MLPTNLSFNDVICGSVNARKGGVDGILGNFIDVVAKCWYIVKRCEYLPLSATFVSRCCGIRDFVARKTLPIDLKFLCVSFQTFLECHLSDPHSRNGDESGELEYLFSAVYTVCNQGVFIWSNYVFIFFVGFEVMKVTRFYHACLESLKSLKL